MARSGGIRRDSRIATQRRLDLVRRLLRGPATADMLIADLRASLGDDIYPPDARAALRHDIAALRETFGCAFFFRPSEGYFLTSLGTLTLLDLDDEELDALALLFAAIDEGAVPRTPQLVRLRNRLRALMPEKNRTDLPAIVPSPRLDLPIHTSGAVDALIARLRPVLGKTEITFQYRSPYTPSDELEQHHVAPYELFQRDGYTYLEAYCIESSLPKLRGRYIPYRLDRIVLRSLRRLARQLPPVRYARRSYRLRYELAPAVAGRRDIALWFAGSTCTYDALGGAVVEACITDLWYARNVLLRYREHCRVLEPPELIVMIRESIERMAALYTMDATAQANNLQATIRDYATTE
jgi:predicted DNA-binding transcriptional regulator YafY